jgi:hypothetical protein
MVSGSFYCFFAPGSSADQRFPQAGHRKIIVLGRRFSMIPLGCLQAGQTRPVRDVVGVGESAIACYGVAGLSSLKMRSSLHIVTFC